MRYLPQLGHEAVRVLERAWHQPRKGWEQKRLLVLRLIAHHKYNAQEVAQIAGVSRSTVFTYLNLFLEKGVKGLLYRDYRGGKKPTMNASIQAQFLEKLRAGEFVRAKEAQAWIEKKTGRRLDLDTVYYWLGKVGGVLKVPRKTHVRKNPAAVEAFRAEAGERLAALVDKPQGKVRLWVADEHRYGLLPIIRRCWSLRGVRVHAPYATKYQWGYLHEAMEVDGENKLQLFFAPRVGKDVSCLFLEQISQVDAQALHLVVWDQAGFHPKDREMGVPANVRLLSLPAYSPELNPVEKLGDLVKDAIANKLFPTLDLLEEAILAELQPYCLDASLVRSLLGNFSLVASANNCVPN